MLGTRGYRSLMAHADQPGETIAGRSEPERYPRWEFEAFYQQGIACYLWELPRPLVKNAFRAVCERWIASGKSVEPWQIRAFIHGCTGDFSKRRRLSPDGYAWPDPPDPSWQLVVCAYPDGTCDLDLVHGVSRRFYSEDNGFFDPPTTNLGYINRSWYEEMGFQVFRMQPYLEVTTQRRSRKEHLRLV